MKNLFILSIVLYTVAGCTTNAITGRSHLSLVNEDALNQEAVSQYRQFLSQNKVLNNNDAAMVKRVGSRLATAIRSYYASKGQSAVLNGFNWEFNLIEGKDVNAWCMPGGKVAVYTGLLPVTKSETAMAIVLGHEITHAIAGHSNERMSQAALAQGLGEIGGAVLSTGKGSGVFQQVYAPAATIGVLLPNSRKQELEADRFGLIFAAMAGYNPQEAIPFWQRMGAASQGAPPTFLSSHPGDEDRLAQLKKNMPEALKYYKKRK